MKVRIKLTENHIFIGLVCLIFAAGAYTIIKTLPKHLVRRIVPLSNFNILL